MGKEWRKKVHNSLPGQQQMYRYFGKGIKQRSLIKIGRWTLNLNKGHEKVKTKN